MAIAPDGTIYTGVEDGRIFAMAPDGGDVREVCNTDGRPLGIEVDGDTLVVCDAARGLLRVHLGSGDVHLLTDSVGGRSFGHINNCAVAPDGSIYFSESTPDWPLDVWIAAIYENRQTGGLLRYDPESGTTEEVVRGIAYANGVAVAKDGSFALVAECARYGIHRVWLSGPAAGTSEILCDNLPGFPDNLASREDGTFWVALANGRDALIDTMWRHPRLRALAFRLPEVARPKEKAFSMVLRIDASGEIVDLLEDPDAAYPFITGMREANGYLYLSSIHGSGLARVRLGD